MLLNGERDVGSMWMGNIVDRWSETVCLACSDGSNLDIPGSMCVLKVAFCWLFWGCFGGGRVFCALCFPDPASDGDSPGACSDVSGVSR